MTVLGMNYCMTGGGDQFRYFMPRRLCDQGNATRVSDSDSETKGIIILRNRAGQVLNHVILLSVDQIESIVKTNVWKENFGVLRILRRKT